MQCFFMICDWSEIDTVLLDMDGTLLDLHFDNYFWLEHVPARYADARGMTVQQAKAEIMPRYQDAAGTLDWYCVDHWSRELELDIVLLKEEVQHLIAVHPHVLAFLELLQEKGKRRILVTNAHQKSLRLKLDRTPLAGHLDEVITSHELGLPKEHPQFWPRLRERIAFARKRTLFVDDSLAVLKAARDFGIEKLLCILLPDTRQPERVVKDFPAVRDFRGLITELSET